MLASGWDDSVREIETRVITAIAALEAVGYLKRGQNNPRVFANSIQVKTAAEARERIEASGKFANKDLENAVRIMSKLLWITPGKCPKSRRRDSCRLYC